MIWRLAPFLDRRDPFVNLPLRNCLKTGFRHTNSAGFPQRIGVFEIVSYRSPSRAKACGGGNFSFAVAINIRCVEKTDAEVECPP
jgi:hypothetical protein